MSQMSFPWGEPDLPQGFSYYPNFITHLEEQYLLEEIIQLPFENFSFQGYQAKRRVVHFGMGYEFNKRTLTQAKAIPEFLIPYRKKIAKIFSVKPDKIAEILVTHYPAGAPIGWHRDAPQFESLFGISLLNPCTMKLRRMTQEKESLRSIVLEPRSGYSIQAEARWMWQHHIPALKADRFSITFRTLKEEQLVHDRDI